MTKRKFDLRLNEIVDMAIDELMKQINKPNENEGK